MNKTSRGLLAFITFAGFLAVALAVQRDGEIAKDRAPPKHEPHWRCTIVSTNAAGSSATADCRLSYSGEPPVPGACAHFDGSGNVVPEQGPCRGK